VTAELPPSRLGGSALTLALLVVAVGLFGVVGGLPYLAGPLLGPAGVLATAAWRRRASGAGAVALLPALAALGTLAATAPVTASGELFGSLATLAFLLWLADDPARPAGGGRRAIPALAACGVGVAVAWSLTLLLPRPSGKVGVAAALLVASLLALAWFLAREAEAPAAVAATA
jgi:hypothetical protein